MSSRRAGSSNVNRLANLSNWWNFLSSHVRSVLGGVRTFVVVSLSIAIMYGSSANRAKMIVRRKDSVWHIETSQECKIPFYSGNLFPKVDLC